MFHLPGGNQLNLLLNIPIVAVLMYSYDAIYGQAVTRRLWIKLNAGLGLFTVAIHGFFFVAGRAEFLQPTSVFVFLALTLLSTWLLLPLARRPSRSMDLPVQPGR